MTCQERCELLAGTNDFVYERNKDRVSVEKENLFSRRVDAWGNWMRCRSCRRGRQGKSTDN